MIPRLALPDYRMWHGSLTITGEGFFLKTSRHTNWKFEIIGTAFAVKAAKASLLPVFWFLIRNHKNWQNRNLIFIKIHIITGRWSIFDKLHTLSALTEVDGSVVNKLKKELFIAPTHRKPSEQRLVERATKQVSLPVQPPYLETWKLKLESWKDDGSADWPGKSRLDTVSRFQPYQGLNYLRNGRYGHTIYYQFRANVWPIDW